MKLRQKHVVEKLHTRDGNIANEQWKHHEVWGRRLESERNRAFVLIMKLSSVPLVGKRKERRSSVKNILRR